MTSAQSCRKCGVARHVMERDLQGDIVQFVGGVVIQITLELNVGFQEHVFAIVKLAKGLDDTVFFREKRIRHAGDFFFFLQLLLLMHESVFDEIEEIENFFECGCITN